MGERRDQGTRTRLSPTQRRAQLLDAAEALLGDHDVASLTFDEVAGAAGVSRALLYNYFSDKGELVAALYQRCIERLETMVRDALLGDPQADTATVTRHVVRCYLRFAQDSPGAMRVMAGGGGLSHPSVQAVHAERWARLEREWGASADVRLVTRGLAGMLDAATLAWLEQPDIPSDRAEAVVTALMLSGVGGLDAHAVEQPPTLARSWAVPTPT